MSGAPKIFYKENKQNDMQDCSEEIIEYINFLIHNKSTSWMNSFFFSVENIIKFWQTFK